MDIKLSWAGFVLSQRGVGCAPFPTVSLGAGKWYRILTLQA